MNWAHVHLILNHVPVIGVPAGLFFFVVALYQSWRSAQSACMRTAYLYSVGVALVTIGTFLSGDQAAEVVSKLPGTLVPMIHEHEETAELAFVITGFSGVVAFLGLVLPWPKSQRVIQVILLVLLVLSTALMAHAANEGGMIRHAEIR